MRTGFVSPEALAARDIAAMRFPLVIGMAIISPTAMVAPVMFV
jgi:hypothetical protein